MHERSSLQGTQHTKSRTTVPRRASRRGAPRGLVCFVDLVTNVNGPNKSLQSSHCKAVIAKSSPQRGQNETLTTTTRRNGEASHCKASHCKASHYKASHCKASHCKASHCKASHCKASHCKASYCEASITTARSK